MRWAHTPARDHPRGRVGSRESHDDLYLHADAVVMKKLPSDQDLMVPLMRDCWS